jgi:acetyltransferase-like isoleucine patch superfamily enzyme
MEAAKPSGYEIKSFHSHGTGAFSRDQFQRIGDNVIFESGTMVFHPENICVGNNVYIGHQTILKGYYRNELRIGDNTWIGQACLVHSAGGVTIGSRVGIGPGVRIISSYHRDVGVEIPILFSPIREGSVVIDDDCDLGVGTIVLPGVRIGKGCQIGAGAVVRSDIPDYSVAVGVPARVIRTRL